MQSLGLSWSHSLPAICQEIHIERGGPVHRGARLLLEAWHACEGPDRFTVGRDVPSRPLAKVLSALALFQPILHGDFRIRLAGQAMRRRYDRDVTGEKLSALMDAAQSEKLAARLRDVLETGSPSLLEVQLQEAGQVRLCYELVALRVYAPDGVTPWIMSGMFFHDWRL